MTNQTSTVSDFSRKAAQEYLQTVVFIDDQIYEKNSNTSSSAASPIAPKQRTKASRRATQVNDSVPDKVIQLEDENYADSYDIVTSFAKKQIICSPYQPTATATASNHSNMFLLCKSADIVILDWNLGDNGRRALELVDELIKQATTDVPEQLRLILIYSGELNLFSIADQLHSKVNKTLNKELEPLDGGLAFHTDNIRVSVLGKPGRERPDNVDGSVVQESDLADVAIREFSKLASGLLHAAALLGLAEVRKNSRKVLSKFNSKLDPGFLNHLALSQPEENAGSHVISLLVSEIESVLQDALPDPLISNRILKDWCRSVWIPGDHLDQVFNTKEVDYRTIAEAICTEGFTSAQKKHNVIPDLASSKKKSEKFKRATKILLPSEDSKSNHMFSHLMSSRTFYDSNSKSLNLGTIIYDVSLDRYLLCIQPVCDSVRLKGTRGFIFVHMEKSSEGSDSGISHVIVSSDLSIIELCYKPKSYLSSNIGFEPDIRTGKVLSKKSEDDKRIFIDCSNKVYFWVDQMKESHAQRAVESFARELSRVGLTESEWLRLLSRG